MAPELPGSHSSGPAEKEKTAKGGEGREAEEPESSAPVPRRVTASPSAQVSSASLPALVSDTDTDFPVY